MTSEEIAYEFQGINGLLLELEGRLNRCFNLQFRQVPTSIRQTLQQARDKVVALAKQFEPPEFPLPDAIKRADDVGEKLEGYA